MSSKLSGDTNTETRIHSPENASGSLLIPPEEMAKITAWLKENNISEVECIVPDLTGNARGKFIPAHQFTEQLEQKLPESILVQTVTGEYTRRFHVTSCTLGQRTDRTNYCRLF